MKCDWIGSFVSSPVFLIHGRTNLPDKKWASHYVFRWDADFINNLDSQELPYGECVDG